MSALLQNLAFLVGEGGEPPPVVKKYYNFDGVNMYAPIPNWQPAGLAFRVRAKALMPLAPTVTQRIFESALHGISGHITATSSKLWATNSEGALVNTGSYARLVAGVINQVEINSDGNKIVSSLNDETSDLGIVPGVFPEQSVDFIATYNGSIQFFAGFIYDLELIDDVTPSNSRHYKMDEGTGATIVDSLNPGVNDGTIQNFNEANWQELPAAGLASTDFGAVPIVDGTAPPSLFKNGLPMDGDKLAVDSAGAAAFYHQGLPFTATARVAVAFATPDKIHDGARPMTAAGRLAMGQPPTHYVHGVPYTALDQVAYTLG